MVIARSHKSVGIAILLALAFGPLGLLYASVTGALVMFFTPIFLWLLFIAGLFQDNSQLLIWSFGFLLAFGLTYWLINIIWAIVAVNDYNAQVDEDARRQFEILTRIISKDQTPVIVNINSTKQENANQTINKPDLQEWLRNNPGKSINDYYAMFKK